ncbi:MAG: hypothetical protein KDA61_09615, partial [Planctomycetales bacterium]|nr:hypothetical protein [Planctomycetales bacterium]
KRHHRRTNAGLCPATMERAHRIDWHAAAKVCGVGMSDGVMGGSCSCRRWNARSFYSGQSPELLKTGKI